MIQIHKHHHHKHFVLLSIIILILTFSIVVIAQVSGIKVTSNQSTTNLESFTIGQSRFSTSQNFGIWKPTSNEPLDLHIQLSKRFNAQTDIITGVTIYDIDGESTDAQTIKKIHELNPKNKVICNMNAGAYESYRGDSYKFPKQIIGKKDNEWSNSYWLDIRRSDVIVPIIKQRMIDWCQNKGFDAIEPDQTDIWKYDSGFVISKEQNEIYNIQIANIAHSLGMSVVLKNNVSQSKILSSYYDFALVEQCSEFNQCNELISSFTSSKKAVFDVEYHVDPTCDSFNKLHVNSQKRDPNLVNTQSKDYKQVSCKTKNKLW